MKLQFENESVALPLVEDQVDLSDFAEKASPEIIRLLEDGITAAKEGDRAEARYLLLRVTEAEPKREEAWFWLASISEYPEELMVFLNNILDINPEHERAIKWAKETKVELADTFVKRGLDSLSEKNQEFAKQCFLHAIVHDNQNENAWFELASIAESPREKISNLKKVLDINPDNEDAKEAVTEAREELAQTLLLKANEAIDADDLEKAEKLLEEVLENDSETDQAWVLKSHLTDSSEEKVTYLERALEINKDNTEAQELLEYVKAEIVESLMANAFSAYEESKEDEARKLLAEVLQTSPDHEDAWLLEARLENELNKKLLLLEKVLSINPDNEEALKLSEETETEKLEALLSDAKEAVKNGENNDAEKLLNKVLEMDSELEEAWLLKIEVTDSYKEKETFIEKVLSINPDNKEALELSENIREVKLESLLSEANDAVAEGEKSDAEKLLEKVLEMDSDLEEAWLLKIEITDSTEEKETFIEKVLSINPDNKEVLELSENIREAKLESLLSEANDAVAEGENDNAEKLLQKIFEMDSTNEEAWLLKVDLAESTEEKESFIERILSINPDNEEALQFQQDAKEDALKELLSKANAAASSGDSPKATSLLDEILANNSELEGAWLLKSHLTDSFSEKIECFKKVLELNPENEIARTNLSSLQMLIQNPINDDELVSQQSEINGQTQELIFKISQSKNGDLELETTPKSEAAKEDNASQDVSELDETTVNAEDEADVADDILETTQENTEVETQFGDMSLPTDELEPILESEPELPTEVEPVEDQYADELDIEEEVLTAEIVEENEENLEPIQMPDSPNELNFDDADASENMDEEESYDDFSDVESEDSDVETEGSDVAYEVEDDDNNTVPVYGLSQEEQEAVMIDCPFCKEENETSAFACGHCGSIVSLSDIEMFFTNQNESNDSILQVVENLEELERSNELSFEELHLLGLGQMNLQKYSPGFENLTKASQLTQDNTLLVAQLDALSMRMAELDENTGDAPPSASKKILVVDDSATVRKLISGKLEKCGHEAICAVDGVDALDILEDVRPDLILLDIAMPRMDGYEVCKKIRANEVTKDIPVIMISGKDGFFDKAQGKLAGTTQYIAKPFGPETLMRTISEYI